MPDQRVGVQVIAVSCAVLVAGARPAIAGFQCGPGGKPKLTAPAGCDCPAGKLSRRVGEHWVCVSALPRGAAAATRNGTPQRADPPSLGVPVLDAPGADAGDVGATTPFTVSSAAAAELDSVEIELCSDEACREIVRSVAVSWTGSTAMTRWPALPAAQHLFWRARNIKQGLPAGAYSGTRAFFTRPDTASPARSSVGATTSTAGAADEPEGSGERREPSAAPDTSSRVAALARRTDGGESAGAASPVAPARDAAGHSGADERIGRSPDVAAPRSVPAQSAPREYASRGHGIGAAAAGIVAVGIGAGFAWYGRRLSGEASRSGAMFDEGRDADGKLSNLVAIGGLAGGAVLIAFGAMLYFDPTPASPQTARSGHRRVIGPLALVPTVSPDGIGLAVTGGLP
jgi:hypothetical protein